VQKRYTTLHVCTANVEIFSIKKAIFLERRKINTSIMKNIRIKSEMKEIKNRENK
jgi:hypothetical protein